MIMAAANNGWLDGDRARGAEQRVAQKNRDAYFSLNTEPRKSSTAFSVAAVASAE